MPGLSFAAVRQMKCPPIYFELLHAELVFSQFQETAEHRRWTLHAASIMPSHFHLVLEVPEDPDARKLLSDLKA